MNIVIVGQSNLGIETFLRKTSENWKHHEGLCLRVTSIAVLAITRGSSDLGSPHVIAGDNILILRDLRVKSAMEGKKE